MCPRNKLAPNWSIWRLGSEEHKFGGTSPLRPLRARERPTSVERFKMAWGNLPVSWLIPTYRVCKLDKSANSLGIFPLKWLYAKEITFSVVILAREAGMVPVRLLAGSFNSWRRGGKSAGNWPTRLLNEKRRSLSFEQFAKLGILPCSVLFSKCKVWRRRKWQGGRNLPGKWVFRQG